MIRRLAGWVAVGGLATGTAALAAVGTLSRLRPDPLGIYLNDHLLGSTIGMELSSRIAATRRTSPEGPVYERLATEIREDRESLLDLMERLDVPVRRYKTVLGWAAEKAGRLKPNGRLLERSPLSDLEELEVMRLGIEGKASCWRTLHALAEREPRLDQARLDALKTRAERQAETLEELRVRTADRLTS